jgi:hypothetical protein
VIGYEGSVAGIRFDFTSSHSDDPKGTVNALTLATIAEMSPHEGFVGQKRREGVTAVQALDLGMTPE